MVTKRKSPAKVRTRTVYRAKPRARRAKTGYDKIAPAMATVALVGVNAGKIKDVWNNATYNTGMDVGKVVKRLKTDNGTHRALRSLVSVDSLVTDGVAVAGGYIGGEIVRKYAPTVIKKPLAKLAKKIPKVI